MLSFDNYSNFEHFVNIDIAAHNIRFFNITLLCSMSRSSLNPFQFMCTTEIHILQSIVHRQSLAKPVKF